MLPLAAIRNVLLKKNLSAAFTFSNYRPMSDGQNQYYDIIISGGGLVGGAMAQAIQSSSYLKDKKTLLLEAQPPPTTKVKSFQTSQPYSNRVIAISPSSKKLLQKLDVWDSIERKRPVSKMQVWDACSDAMITFDKEDVADDLCYIIENNMITSSIQNILENSTMGHLNTIYNSKIKSFTLPRNYARDDPNKPLPNVKIELENGDALETALLVAADGARSFIAQEANISKVAWTYKQSAVVATLVLEEPTENFQAWQRFLPEGPIAMLPLDDQHSSLVWSTSHEHAESLCHMNNDDFVAEVNDAYCREYPRHEIVDKIGGAFKDLMKEISNDHGTLMNSMQLPPVVSTLQGDKAKFPLGLSHCNEYVRPRLAIIGDAAHRVHPLAGQGANLGFGDVACLTKVLETAVYQGEDIGCISQLIEYESERQIRNVSVVGTLDALNKLYSTDALPVVLLRSLGLMGTNASKYIKKQIIKQAMM
uniref:ubiquinone biosynthesis monooxygenase COQ6, mitochondrial-like isoform X2 n=1 Tax=Styela clava TaxID=7725 RepID=UPI00193AA8AB|nr:ubiquinone biosynthesis monooxygenase COQ6, mitochondrial-like isoform X2 [Styela clava]